VAVPDEQIADLKRRLTSARIGHSQLEDVEDFSYGFSLPTLLSFRDHWLKHYDWRKWEAVINTFPQYRTGIEGLQVHFLHVKPDAAKAKGKRVVPLLLIHGWPGNVFEFHKLIPLLTEAEAKHGVVFEVVAPSIPGYGWSEQPHKQGGSVEPLTYIK